MKYKIDIMLIGLLCMVGLLPAVAQEHKKFSPEKFEADMEAYITREASLTPQEAAAFFPLFREMHQKQRAVYDRVRQTGKQKPADDKAATEIVKQCDKLSLEAKQIEQQYHNKMLKALAPSKVYEAIRAESRFHRQMMKGWQKKQGGGKPTERPKGKRP